MTPSQTRAMRAKQLLDSGRDAHEVARDLGYTRVSAMLGAISLCSKAIEREEKKILQMIMEDPPKVISKVVTENGVRAELVFHTDEPVLDLLADGHPDPGCSLQAVTRETHAAMHADQSAPTAKIYPIKNGIITIDRELCSVTYKPDVRTAFINLKAYRKWMPRTAICWAAGRACPPCFARSPRRRWKLRR